MKYSGEVPLPNSAEGMLLRGDLEDIFQANAQKVFIDIRDDTFEGLEANPTEIFLGGRVPRIRPGLSVVVGLLARKLQDQETTIIAFDGQKYEVAHDGVRHAVEPKEPLDDENIRRLRYWISPRSVKWSANLSLMVPIKFQQEPIDDSSLEDEIPEYEFSQAESLRWDLDQLFANQPEKIESLLDDDSEFPDVKFLGGLIKSGENNGYATIDIVRWEDEDGCNNTSITVDSNQYLVTGNRIVFADSQDEELSDADIEILRYWVQPEEAWWLKSCSKELANHQLEIYEALERQL